MIKVDSILTKYGNIWLTKPFVAPESSKRQRFQNYAKVPIEKGDAIASK